MGPTLGSLEGIMPAALQLNADTDALIGQVSEWTTFQVVKVRV